MAFHGVDPYWYETAERRRPGGFPLNFAEFTLVCRFEAKMTGKMTGRCSIALFEKVRQLY
jgi:hypothetical protein